MSELPPYCRDCGGSSGNGTDQCESCKGFDIRYAKPQPVSPPPPERETALRELVEEAVELLKHVHVLDCGAHYCRYCPARSPEWEHTPSCPYEESQKHNTRAAKVRRELAALLAASPETGWRDTSTAPTDRWIWVYAPSREGLPAILCPCRYHESAGFCVDELRVPTLWHEMFQPAPPAGPKGT